MKGRLYDPQLRRFITPDPFVTDPLNPQGMNRYAYVQNNPLMFTDPSGFEGMLNGEPAPSLGGLIQVPTPSSGIEMPPMTFSGGPPAAQFPSAGGPQPGYMVSPSTPPPGGGADMASARAEGANQSAQMQQMGQIANYESTARVSNSVAGSSTVSAPSAPAGQQPGARSVFGDGDPSDRGYNGIAENDGRQRILPGMPCMSEAGCSEMIPVVPAFGDLFRAGVAAWSWMMGTYAISAAEEATMLANATRAFPNSPLTLAGRALTKHPEVVGFTKTTLRLGLRTSAELNGAAAKALELILKSGRAYVRVLPRYGRTIEIIGKYGVGARFVEATKEFIGFISK